MKGVLSSSFQPTELTSQKPFSSSVYRELVALQTREVSVIRSGVDADERAKSWREREGRERDETTASTTDRSSRAINRPCNAEFPTRLRSRTTRRDRKQAPRGFASKERSRRSPFLFHLLPSSETHFVRGSMRSGLIAPITILPVTPLPSCSLPDPFAASSAAAKGRVGEVVRRLLLVRRRRAGSGDDTCGTEM